MSKIVTMLFEVVASDHHARRGVQFCNERRRLLPAGLLVPGEFPAPSEESPQFMWSSRVVLMTRSDAMAPFQALLHGGGGLRETVEADKRQGSSDRIFRDADISRIFGPWDVAA